MCDMYQVSPKSQIIKPFQANMKSDADKKEPINW